MSDTFDDVLDGMGAEITSLDGVKRYFGLDPAESPTALIDAVKEGTECGMQILLSDEGIVLYSMVEGGQGEASLYPFDKREDQTRPHTLFYPFTAQDLTTVLNVVEEEAADLWRQANLPEREGVGVDISVESYDEPVSGLEGDTASSNLYVIQIVMGPSGHQIAGTLEDLHRIVSTVHAKLHDRLREAGKPVDPDEMDEPLA